MSEMRQRWRLTVSRGPEARHVAHGDVVAGWEAGLRASGLALAESPAARPRPKILFAAPASVGMLGERELIDIGLTECRLVHEVRQAVGVAAPRGYGLVDLYDVWTGAPTLPSLVVAADYVASVTAGSGTESVVAGLGESLDSAIADLVASPHVEVQREKGGSTVTVDIRPHLLQVRGEIGADGSIRLNMRLRLGGTAGVGRPEEVVGALAELLGRELAVTALVRDRIHLADEPPQD
jgi:radical SAM-linked protein